MLYVLVGFLTGTLVEYFIHRLVGHGPGSRQSRSKLVSRHEVFHHRVFTARRGLTAERGSSRREHIRLQLSAVVILLGLSVVPAIGAALAAIAAPVAEQATRADYLWPAVWGGIGLVATIATYNILHHMHHVELPAAVANLPLYKQARAWHHAHHLEPDSRFGLVLPLWDLVFRTHVGLEDLEPTRKEPPTEEAAKTRSGNRKRPTTTVASLLEDAMADAEADFDDQGKGKERKKTRKKAETVQERGAAAPRKPTGTGPQLKKPVSETDPKTKRERPQTKTGGNKRPTTRSGGRGSTRPAQTSTSAWLASLDGDVNSLEIQTTAVAVDDD